MSKQDPNKRTYYPAKTFDDDLTTFVDLFNKKGWAFSGVDSEKLKTDPDNQRNERKEHDALELAFTKMHQDFGIAQEERYQRFSAALNAARGAFSKDKTVMAELAHFKRSIRPAAKKPESGK